VKKLIRADLESMPDYTPVHGVDPQRVIKLDSNENAYGPSPRVLAALAETRTWQYYFGQEQLAEALAQYSQVQPENIVVTNGGDEALDLTLRAVLEPGDVVLDAPPSFEMYRIYTLANRAVVLDLPRRDDFSLDVERVIRASQLPHVKAIVLASPNNPDGGLLPRQDLLGLLELPLLVVLDEAYFEFAGESAVDLLPQHPNLVIVRTFSKWAGLASLRVGYIIAARNFAHALHKLRSPYNVNWAGLVAASESLKDKEYLMGNVRKLIDERERMRAPLERLGWLAPLPSHTNFLLLRVREQNPQQVRLWMAERGIWIRAFQSARLRDYIRISIGTPPMNDAVLQALQEL
jgi:histidinol-phosphate aminotransferase